MMYGNTRQTLIRPSNHHPSPPGRWAKQAIPANGKKGGNGFNVQLYQDKQGGRFVNGTTESSCMSIWTPTLCSLMISYISQDAEF